MALLKGNKNEIPEDAVVLSREDALRYQIRVLKNWKHLSDVYEKTVLPGIVLQDECAICLELRAASLQASTSCIFPAVLAPLSTLSLALLYNTYNVPSLTSEPMKVFKLWKTQTKPISNILFAIFVGQALAGSVMTYIEAKSIEKVNERLTLLGYELENE
ncbi:hypothetical protein FQA39_LY01592 [Lamprigera yunnana]|nr:hypothetical protein FQA39_LY01592 [Lamprigera yunnana]